MSYKKILVIIFVVVLGMLGMMFATSYAWYSFSNGSTTFSAVTSNDQIDVTFLKGEYINTSVAVPINSTEIDKYSDKHQFVVRPKNNLNNNEIMVSVSLTDIVMDSDLWVEAFKIALYHQGSEVAVVDGGEQFTAGGATEFHLADVSLENRINNQFELRIYLFDDGTDQSALMNQSFQAKIKVEVISRLVTNITDWDDAPDIYISSITIDGEESDYLPTEGYYSMTSVCDKGSNLIWEPLGKVITYTSGSKVNDSCSLTFSSSTDYPLLSEMPVGSYVDYVGNNGCVGKSCEGYNANYVNESNMGYCHGGDYQFVVNGWRVAYIKNGSVHLISAGSPECVPTYVQRIGETSSSSIFGTDYYYGSGYTFDEVTGKYSLTGITSTKLKWSVYYEYIISKYPYTCGGYGESTCSYLYKVISYVSDTYGVTTLYYNNDSDGLPRHIPHLDQVALKYCNVEYAKGGVCDETTAWAMDENDFTKMTGNTLKICNSSGDSKSCGFANDLFDNGSNYWYATNRTSNTAYYFDGDNRSVSGSVTNFSQSDAPYGVRPILELDSEVLVVGGAGTYEDPYRISLES